MRHLSSEAVERPQSGGEEIKAAAKEEPKPALTPEESAPDTKEEPKPEARKETTKPVSKEEKNLDKLDTPPSEPAPIKTPKKSLPPSGNISNETDTLTSFECRSYF